MPIDKMSLARIRNDRIKVEVEKRVECFSRTKAKALQKRMEAVVPGSPEQKKVIDEFILYLATYQVRWTPGAIK